MQLPTWAQTRAHTHLYAETGADICTPAPSHLQPLSLWRIHPGPGLLDPSFSALTPRLQPAPPLRKYSSGVPRAAQEMLCTLRVSQAIFCPRTGGRLGQEQPVMTQSAIFCFFLYSFFSASTICSQCFSVSVSLSCPCIFPLGLRVF